MWQGVGMRAIPLPVRERIIRLYEQGKSTTEIAEFSGFCVAAVRRVRQHFKARGTFEPQTHFCGRKTLLTAQRKARLQKLVADQPDATLAELGTGLDLSLIHISEPTRLGMSSYAVFCLKKK